MSDVTMSQLDNLCSVDSLSINGAPTNTTSPYQLQETCSKSQVLLQLWRRSKSMAWKLRVVIYDSGYKLPSPSPPPSFFPLTSHNIHAETPPTIIHLAQADWLGAASAKTEILLPNPKFPCTIWHMSLNESLYFTSSDCSDNLIVAPTILLTAQSFEQHLTICSTEAPSWCVNL